MSVTFFNNILTFVPGKNTGFPMSLDLFTDLQEQVTIHIGFVEFGIFMHSKLPSLCVVRQCVQKFISYRNAYLSSEITPEENISSLSVDLAGDIILWRGILANLQFADTGEEYSMLYFLTI